MFSVLSHLLLEAFLLDLEALLVDISFSLVIKRIVFVLGHFLKTQPLSVLSRLGLFLCKCINITSALRGLASQ